MDNYIDSLFAAMADPTRRAVIEKLAAGPSPVSQLHAPHNMALPSFMKHLTKLENAGLINSRKIGRVRMVELQPGPMEQAENWIAHQRRIWNTRLDALTDLAETTDPEKDNT